MGVLDLVSELSPLVHWPRAFREAELFDFPDSDVTLRSFHEALLADCRFIRMDWDSERYYILDSSLFHWFARLNVRLARAGRCCLNRGQLARLLSSLVSDGPRDSPPDSAVQWADSVGLATASCRPEEYVFPLARVLSFLSPPSMTVVEYVLRDIAETRMWTPPLDHTIVEAIEEGFSLWSETVVTVVRSRERLDTEHRGTLAHLGQRLMLSRERVRQIEEKFWRAVWGGRRHPTSAERQRGGIKRPSSLPLSVLDHRFSAPFIKALVFDFFNHRGELTFFTGSGGAAVRRFLAKCAGIPVADFPRIGLSVVGSREEAFQAPEVVQGFPDSVSAVGVAARLGRSEDLTLSAREAGLYAQRLAAWNWRRLSRSQRVYLALREIGRPAHYSRVAEVHNSLFPDHPCAEHNVHAALNRHRGGVVWIGIRGTFALREWGWERPERTLHKAVSEIVHRVYRETGNPVPFSLIVAEIGKHRRLVKPSSLVVATQCNLELRRIGAGSFVPRSPGDESFEESSGEELDRILREFEEGC